MAQKLTAGQKLYDIVLALEPIGSFEMGQELNEKFPQTKGITVDSRAIYDLSRLVKKQDIPKQGTQKSKEGAYKHFMESLLQHAIDKGETEFEIHLPKPMETFPFYVQAKEQRVKIAIVGNLKNQGMKGAENMDIAIYGSAGNDFLLFGKNCRAYVEGTVGPRPLFQTENCSLDTYGIGANPICAQNGNIIVRGEPLKKIHNASNMIELLDEAAPLYGRISHLLIRVKAKKMVSKSIKETGLALQCAGPSTKYFQHIDYKQPDWIPQRIYSQPVK